MGILGVRINSIIAMSGLLFGTLGSPALAQTASAQMTDAELQANRTARKIITIYVDGLKEFKASGVSDEDAMRHIQARVERMGGCIIQRSYLAGRETDAMQKQQYVYDSELFSSHYLYFALALESLGVVEASRLIEQWDSSLDIMSSQISAVYEANAKGSSGQASDAVLNLANTCNALKAEISGIERRVSSGAGSE